MPTKREILQLVLTYLKTEQASRDQERRHAVNPKTLGDFQESRERLIALIKNEFPDESESLRESNRSSSPSRT